MKDMALNFSHQTWLLVGEMSPYLLLGFALAGLLEGVFSPRFIQKTLGTPGWGGILKATLLGVPLPVCSCGVIPLAAFIRRKGAGKGATAAFAASTPQTGADSILATYALLGPVFTAARVAVTVITGLVSGLLVDLFVKDENPPAAAGINAGEPADEPRKTFSDLLRYGLVELPREIAWPLLAGLLLAGILGAAVPDSFFSQYTASRWTAYLAVTALSVPLYVCATGSIPLAFALLQAGLTPGAALIFLVAGPATNAATLSTLGTLLGRKALAFYLAAIILGAWTAGFLFDVFITTAPMGAQPHEHAAGMSWIQHLSGAALLLLLAYAIWSGRKAAEKPASGAGTVFRIEGMTCAGCVETVKNAALSCPGVEAAAVSLQKGTAEITGREFDTDAVRNRIEDHGYTVTGVSS